MRSLFVRLFLSFLLIMVLSAIFSSLIFSTFRNLRIETFKANVANEFHTKIAKMILVAGKAAHEVYLNNSMEVYQKYINEMSNSFDSEFYSISPDTMNTIDHKPVPPELQQLAVQAKKMKTLILQRDRGHLFVAQFYPPSATEEGIIIAAIHTPGPPPGMRIPMPPRPSQPFRPFFDPNQSLLKLVIIILASGLVCFFLARSLTSPLRSLRNATQKIAEGELNTRTGSTTRSKIREIAALSRDFDIMAEKVENVLNDQKRLLRDISHELRSPLARLHIALEMVKNNTGSSSANLARIEQEAVRLNNLVGQILEISRYESGNTTINKTSFDLIPLVENLINDALFEADQSKEILYNYDLLPSDKAEIHANHELTARAIENIIRNSIKYTPDFSQVEISLLNTNDGYICIQIKDGGPGIPEDKIDKLTRPFYRVEDARTRKTGGTGVGLTIASQAIKLNNGYMKIFNNPEKKGLIVQVFLPLADLKDS